MKNKIPLIISIFSLIIAISTYFFLENEIEDLYKSNVNLRSTNDELNQEITSLKLDLHDLKLEIANTPDERNVITKATFYASLDSNVFLTDFKNHEFSKTGSNITSREAGKIAEKGFERSALYIASEGADDTDSQTIKSQEICANTYFTKHPYDGYGEVYQDIKRTCYVVTRENEMGCGISVYVDAETGLIIGGEAFGD